jgi:hypothetical protein
VAKKRHIKPKKPTKRKKKDPELVLNMIFGEPDYDKHPSLVEYIEHQLPKKHLILTGGQGTEPDVIANSIATDLKDNGETINEIKHVRGCSSKSEREIIDEICHDSNISKTAVVLYDIDSKANFIYLNRFTRRLLRKEPPYLILILRPNEDGKNLPKGILALSKIIDLSEPAKEVGSEEGQATESGIRLRIVKNREEVYWEGNLLPTIKGTDFRIFIKLVKTPKKLVKNEKLYELIKSDYNKDVLLNQRITAIRKAFPSPYSDIKQSQCIIPDAKRNKGYRSLNLTKEQVAIV